MVPRKPLPNPSSTTSTGPLLPTTQSPGSGSSSSSSLASTAAAAATTSIDIFPNPKFRMEDFRRDFESQIDHAASKQHRWRPVVSSAGDLSGPTLQHSHDQVPIRPLRSVVSMDSNSRTIPRKPLTAESSTATLIRQQTAPSLENSSTIWGETSDGNLSSRPSMAKLHQDGSSLNLSTLSIQEDTNPWQPESDSQKGSQNHIPSLVQDPSSEAWTHVDPPTQTPPPIPLEHDASPESSSDEWDDDPVETPNHGSDDASPPSASESLPTWKENEDTKEKGLVELAPIEPIQANPWVGNDSTDNVVGRNPVPAIEEHLLDAPVELPADRPLPPLPERQLPPPPQASGSIAQAERAPTTAESIAEKQKETYGIKKITWHDDRAAKNPRTSPILVQNANGPCPLLALVNALILSTPAELSTSLVDVLKTREQVSLGLLLDAVFDELMSGRRGNGLEALSDVSELYAFLVTLHTGMNVNPLFLNPASADPSFDASDSVLGTFEDTREMKLYGTFGIPLIHGWIPARDSTEFTALARSAKSYEDAQNLLFREDELEEKLSGEGLNFEEQAVLEDIASVRAFLATSATQLTPHGLDIIRKHMVPGSMAIFFRNDHFSTLYRHPHTDQLMQLVTDMGYASHEEVVWESLGNVNGDDCDFFSGDFRLVGGASQSSRNTSGDGWTTVARRGNRSAPPQSRLEEMNENFARSSGRNLSAHAATQDLHAGPYNSQSATPSSPNAEQEDHDLALALQLQEEEEERHREELARRRREQELSQQFIEQQGRGPNTGRAANIPVSIRGGQAGRGRGRGGPTVDTRPAIPPRTNVARPADPEAGIDAPPPSYEQAATEQPYNPPPDHPSHPTARRGTASARSPSTPTPVARGPPSNAPYNRSARPNPNRSMVGEMNAVSPNQGRRDGDRDCIVM